MAEEYLYNGIWSESHDCVFLLAQGVEESSEYEHTLVYFDNGSEWELDTFLNWDSVSINTDFEGDIVVIGIDGNFAIKKGDGYVEGEIEDYPVLSSSFKTGDFLFVVGLSSAIYKYCGSMQWALDANGIEGNNDFSGIGGGSEVIFIVGDRGVCYCRSGDIWQEEVLPTNENLKSVSVNEKGLAIICGQNGMLLVGKPGYWETIDHEYVLDDFWSVKYLMGRFFIAGNNCIYDLTFRGEWVLVPIFAWDIEENGLFCDMFYEGGARDRLWVISEKGLAFMHRNEWDRLY